MEKIAIISDIHGNLEALKTVLNDIEKRKIKKIYCLGDIIAKGNHQEECIKLIKDKCDVIIRGNCDEAFSNDNLDLTNLSDVLVKRYHWINKMLSKENKDFLLSLPYCYEFYMSGRLIRLLHAHPKKNDLFLGDTDDAVKLYDIFLPSENTISDLPADVLVYGHIHRQYLRRLYNRTVVNVGSVGNSFDVFRNEKKDADVKNTTVANYLIIKGVFNSKDINNELSFEFINLPYDIEKELNTDCLNVEKDLYEKEIREGIYRDMQKVYNYFDEVGFDKEKI